MSLRARRPKRELTARKAIGRLFLVPLLYVVALNGCTGSGAPGTARADGDNYQALEKYFEESAMKMATEDQSGNDLRAKKAREDFGEALHQLEARHVQWALPVRWVNSNLEQVVFGTEQKRVGVVNGDSIRVDISICVTPEAGISADSVKDMFYWKNFSVFDSNKVSALKRGDRVALEGDVVKSSFDLHNYAGYGEKVLSVSIAIAGVRAR